MEDKCIVTESEWKIMELLWQNESLTMPRITQALQEETGWSKHTVISLLKRMCQKGSAEIIDGTSPMAYRAIDEILDVIEDTAEVTALLTPIYNFKASKAAADEETMDGND